MPAQPRVLGARPRRAGSGDTPYFDRLVLVAVVKSDASGGDINRMRDVGGVAGATVWKLKVVP